MPTIDFWFSIGSTYTYLTVMRIDAHAAAQGVAVNWRPFNVRYIMMQQNNIPFAQKPVKTAYMWRDIERRAAMYGLPTACPAPYPLTELQLANQVAVLGMRDGWGRDYTRAAYHHWFVDGHPAGSDPNLTLSLEAAGQEADRVIAEAHTAAAEDALAEETVQALETGIFGAPSFSVGTEVFWGDDRLDDALTWARHGALG